LPDNGILERAMGQAPITLTVSPDEFRMLSILRDLPESPLRVRVQRLLDELLAFARNPRCSEFQADGVPCGNPAADCEQCQIVAGMLDRLARDWPRNQPESGRP
jgi:hypothetical protein